MIEPDYIQNLLRTIDDPEMPISIVDLGIVQDVRIETTGRAAGHYAVTVDLLPTFVGCPALDVLRELVTTKLRNAGASDVTVNFLFDPPWGVERISDAGRERLRSFGVSVPTRGGSCAGHSGGGSESGCQTTVPPKLVTLGLPEIPVAGPASGAAPAPDVDPAALYAGDRESEAVECPLCGSQDTLLQSPFGPTRCKMIYHCNACRNPFERIKRV